MAGKKSVTKSTTASKDLVVKNNHANTLSVMTELNIGMDQMVSVGVAKLERELKIKIKDLRATADKFKTEITNIEKQMPKLAESALPAVIKTARKKISTAITSLKIPNVTFETDISVDSDSQENKYTLTMKKKGTGYYERNESILLVKHSCKFTAPQKTLIAKLNKTQEQLSETNRMAITLQQKLADAPAMERQMKARIVEQQLSTTEAGQEILDNMMANFDIDLDMIG